MVINNDNDTGKINLRLRRRYPWQNADKEQAKHRICWNTEHGVLFFKKSIQNLMGKTAQGLLTTADTIQREMIKLQDTF